MIYTIPFLMIITLATTIAGFYDVDLERRWMGYPYGTAQYGEWYRLVTAGLLHGDIVHLIFNLYSMSIFVPILVRYWWHWGWWAELFFVLLYGGAILSANIFSYYKYRKNAYYNHMGPSAGVIAVMSAAICHAPSMQMRFFLLPFGVPAGLYLTFYLLMTFWRKDSTSRTDYFSHGIGGMYGIFFMIFLQYIEIVLKAK